MARFRFEAGAEYKNDGAAFRIIDAIVLEGSASWLVKRLDDGSTLSVRRDELERLYASGKVERHGTEDGVGDGAARNRRRFVELSEADLGRRTSRRAFLKLMQEHAASGCMTVDFKTKTEGGPKNLLEATLRLCAPQAGLAKVPSIATYYRWRAMYDPEDSSGLVGNFSRRGNRFQVDPMLREAIMASFRHALDKAVEERSAGRLVVIDGAKLRSLADMAVKLLNAKTPERELKAPCQATLYAWWKTQPAVLRDTVKLGPAEARKRYRTIKGHDHAQLALDRVEYDETKLPFFFFDEALGIPLGRATLSWFLDTASQSVLGWYNGFEGAGDLAMTSAARHMCTPKAYVNEEYSFLKNVYIQHGIPRCIGIDNSKTAWARTADVLCQVVDTDWDWCPSRTPYFKPIVELMFAKLNEQLLQHLPGFVLPKTGIYGDDYDPAANAVLGIRHFQMIFTAWLVDFYHPRRQKRLGASPNEVFARGIAQVPAGLMDRASDLRLAFAIVRDGRLNRVDHKGVLYEGLHFRGEALQLLRMELGSALKLRIKVDPSDLRSIYVWHPSAKAWIEVAAVRLDYAKGRTLHQHLIIRKHEREKYGTDGERLLEAERDLASLIATVVGDAQSIRRNTLVARYLGIGTDAIFRNLDHDGRLHQLTGPFTGQKLNPMASAPFAGKETTRVIPMLPSIEPAGIAGSDDAVPVPAPVATQVPTRRKFKADLSLLKAGTLV